MSQLPENWTQLRVDTPAIYRVRVRGHVDSSKRVLLGGMQITNERPSEGDEVSSLIGRVADQSTLVGVLNALSDMRLPLLSVDCIEVEVRATAGDFTRSSVQDRDH